jgi:NDP-sugar pyrophosphorylase family protein
MPLGEKSIIEIVLSRLNDSCVEKVTISLGYLGQIIETLVRHQSDKYKFEINFVYEDYPLGTAGPLSLLEKLSNDDQIFVINGDTYSDFEIDSGFKYFHENKNDILIIAKRRTEKLDYGVLNLDSNNNLVSYLEKPSNSYLVSTGMYYLNSACIQNSIQHIDMPDLIIKNKLKGKIVRVLETTSTWYDLGRKEDFEIVSKELNL